MRQTEGLDRFEAFRTGGRVQHLGGVVFDQHGSDQLGVDPRSGQLRRPSGEIAKFEDTFPAFEDDLDLPAETIRGYFSSV